jgi:hypothetical protein
MKSIREWYDELPEVVKDNAIQEVVLQRGLPLSNKVINFKVATMYIALQTGFTHAKSQQGIEYWMAVCKEYDF